MKKQILFIFSLLIFSFCIHAQSLTCEEALNNISCHSLDGLTSTLPESNSTNQPPASSCGITAHNTQWCSFVAGTSIIFFNINVGDCFLPSNPPCNTLGVQTAVYSSCGPDWTLVACGPSGGSSNTPPNTTQQFVIGNLTIGETYLFMLDGNCNAICDYSIEVADGEIMTNLPNPLAVDFGIDVDTLLVDFINMTTGANGFVWDFGDGNASTDENPQHEYAQTGNYSVTLTAFNECDTVILTQIIEVAEPVVAALFTAMNNSVCSPVMVEFIDLSTNSPTSWFWEFEGGTPPNSTEQNPIVNYTTSGTYAVMLSASNSSGDSTIIDSITVVANPQPEANFIFETNGGLVTFSNSSIDADTYEWIFGDGNFSQNQNPQHVYFETNVYEVFLIVTNECGADTISQLINVEITDLENISVFETFDLFPNPNNGQFQLNIEGKPFDKLEINMFDILGQKVMEEQINFSSGKLNKIIQVQNPTTVTYILQIRLDEQIIHKKIVIE